MTAPAAEPTHRYATAVRERRMAVGVFCCLDGASVAQVFAAAGADFLVIDHQHAAYGWPQLEELCFRVRASGAAVFVRTASTAPEELNLVLDLPVDGVVLPNIASVAEAEQAVATCRLPPGGRRSLGNERGHAVWAAYDAPDPLLGLLVEEVGALDDLEGIVGVGVDFLWLGTHDLSAAMGLDWRALDRTGVPPAELVAAHHKVRDTANRHGVAYWSSGAWGPDGASAMVAGVDARIVRRAAEEAISRCRIV